MKAKEQALLHAEGLIEPIAESTEEVIERVIAQSLSLGNWSARSVSDYSDFNNWGLFHNDFLVATIPATGNPHGAKATAKFIARKLNNP